MPLPYGPVGPVLAYVRAHPVAVQVIATAAFASSAPLAVYAATAGARLRQFGATAPGATIALTGGTLAAGALGLTGLLGWTLSRPGGQRRHRAGSGLGHRLVFLVGGPGHMAALGLLVVGISVPSLTLRLTPRTVAWTGVVIAGLAELTTLVLVWPRLGVVLPIARVSALGWLVVVGALLARRDLDAV